MVRTVRSSVCVEKRHQAAEALHESIAVQVSALRESGEWEQFLAFAGAFHSDSLSNVLLILSQYRTATKVAGSRKWQTLGRQVRRGEKSIRIFGYRTIKTDDTTPTNAAGEAGRGIGADSGAGGLPDAVRVRHRPDRPHRPDAGDSAALAQQLEGEDPAGIAAAVTDYLAAADGTVTRETLPGNANGYTTTVSTRRVVIEADLSPAQTRGQLCTRPHPCSCTRTRSREVRRPPWGQGDGGCTS